MDASHSVVAQLTEDARSESMASQNSQTAKEFIDSQLQLEADAREALPYAFDSCTHDLGPLRQVLFACLTCNPPPTDSNKSYTAAAVCYSCSIACHGEHTLVELFNKRNFVCDCGTTRLPSTSCCTLREDPVTGKKGVHSQEAAAGNAYNHNFRNQFCGCGEQYDAYSEKGTMYQCLGLGTVETGGCGEDWWHPECLIGLSRDWNKPAPKVNGIGGGDATNEDSVAEEEDPLPPGFPAEDDFDHLICFKCIDSNPWIKPYAGTPGFLPPVFREGGFKKAANVTEPNVTEAPFVPATEHKETEPKEIDSKETESKHQEKKENSKKRKVDDEGPTEGEPVTKRTKEEEASVEEQLSKVVKEEEPTKEENDNPTKHSSPKHTELPKSIPMESFSLFALDDFHSQLCRCAECFPKLVPYPQLREEEDTYEPPMSDDGQANGAASVGTGSIYDRGEAALNNMDRVRAIEGAMAYNHLRDKLKVFLQPFAESGQAVSAEDIKGYFEALRGDEQGIKDAANHASTVGRDGKDDASGGKRHEQNGK
ncbi:Metaphase-anaphase transition protein (Mlo2), putative [Penicillium digitatum PHI26]|uniref:Metaphase-anaphase transition protein (Mlo2), putative n=2 Tax=Penicillium digitatum TaxID=36651 RepID=K9G424_PEND2|nr:Metaphase-anaphase transition protein (Mlo2), putative [Penicillium digitatum Pd1]EKV16124.1 Metaphase-anaphase transition protein (Mlo2), putative [Penicillium digitatum PHI26]EKV19408.1 Metaphase-anaphase transition protein (Mlo2), putative [Penicillium digitatum Pd1]